MDLGIQGRVAVVGGASSGLGAACADGLAAAGCRLLIWARDEARLEAAATRLRAAGASSVEVVRADAAAPSAASEVAAAVLERYGRADILVLNAGGPPPGDAAAPDRDALRSALQLLTETPIDLCGRLLPGMREHGWGRIVAILSWGVREPIATLPLSNIGRSALAAWLKGASLTVAGDGVTVNGVLPGRFATPRIEAVDAARAEREGITLEAVRAQALANVPAGRDGRPEELGSLVAFLCSDRASYINGAFVPVDGGMLRSLG